MSAPVSDSAVDLLAGVPTDAFIAGRWRRTGEVFAVTDPATDEVLSEVADVGAAVALTALDAADAAQPAWARTPPRQRAELLRRAFDAVTARADDVARVITLESGKPLREAKAEVTYGAEFLRWFSEQACRPAGTYGPSPDGSFRIVTTRRPVGPCLLITPWNFPLAMGTRKIGAALAAGCTVVVKPAPQTPLTMLLLAAILGEAGVPDGVVNVVPTSDAAAQSRALMADSRLRKVSFTGSTAVGSLLLEQAAPHVLRTSMELGGNGPFLVLADADVDAAVEGAMLAKFRNGGQSCVAANRFLVHDSLAERFTAALAERAAALVTGHGLLPDTTLGPLIDRRQRERVDELVAGAVRDGARVVTGGAPLEGPGAFYAPTVLADVPRDARIGAEEVFGPVAPVWTFSDIDEGIAMANDTRHGLVAYVWTRDASRALAVAESIDCGMVGVNRGLVSDAAAPFGGTKASGLGREGGDAGIDEYTEASYLAVQL
jgi:succinate-semialdehyde dehydrogenase/glutarate-semialdehyde dehydrogenase